MFPDFNNSIYNVSSTLQKYLGLDNGAVKIAQLETALNKQYKNVILLVVDGLGMSVLENHLPAKSFLWRNMAQRITSVFPATTTCGTTTLITAEQPAEHGWFAWEMNFAGRIIELFKNKDRYSGEQMPDGYVRNKLPTVRFWEKKGLRKDVTCYALFPDKIKMKSSGDSYFSDLPDMGSKLSELCRQEGRKFIYAYFSELDSVMHDNGATSRKAKKLVRRINKEFEQFITGRDDTLLIITADHSQCDIKGFVDIYKDKEITQCMEHPFSCEPRATAFYIKKGMHEQFKNAFKKYEDDFTLFETKELIDKGVFGTFKDDNYKKYLGDYIAIGKDTNKFLLFAENRGKHGSARKTYKGHHTGMTKEEMAVPLIIV